MSETIATLQRHLIGDRVYLGPERRRAVRVPVTTPILVAPLNERCAPNAAAQRATLIDFSTNGVGFIGPVMSEAPYFMIDFSKSGVNCAQLLARVAWTRVHEDYAKYGCEFVADVGEL